jgi:DNA recombination protein RmuC
MLIGAFVVGAILGGLAVWLVLRERIRAQQLTAGALGDTFKALSAETLQQTTTSFLDLAKDKIEGVANAQLQPIKESLQRFDEKVERLEHARQQERGALSEQLLALKEGADKLRGETASLVGALRSSEVRGQWGQLQLENTLELAGMLEHCDFNQEVSVTGDDGLLRPDVVVRLPGGKNIVIDAKVPGLDALLNAFQTDDEAARSRCLDEFVRLLRDKIRRLGEKAYARQFMPAPDFVIMFLPSESLYRAAIERDASLLQLGPQQRVILASPTSLIVLLLTAAAAWREQTIAESAREVSEQGQLLYERLSKMNDHFAMLGRSLGRAVEAFNKTLGSLETRVFPAARKLTELGVSGGGELASVEPIEVAARDVNAPELGEGERATRAADAA